MLHAIVGAVPPVQSEPLQEQRPLRTQPNILFIITDDQDQMLGGSFPQETGATPMPQAKMLLGDAGATATQMFAHTPLCCPSRAELLSGRYFHNIKSRPGASNALDKLVVERQHVDIHRLYDSTFSVHLHDAGYQVGIFGKFLNVAPNNDWTVPPAGVDAWLANGGGAYTRPEFGASGLAPFSGIDDGMVRFPTKDITTAYTTAVVGNMTLQWIRHIVGKAPHRPFFAYVAPKAAHEPFIPAPWHLDAWPSDFPEAELRPPPFNASASEREDKHGNIRVQPMLTTEAARVITGVFKNRWRTLMSVDDLIGEVVATCDDLGILEDTFILFTSDHGFTLGENNMIMDKRHVYDWNTRVHLLARGPGIPAGSVFRQPATLVDLAPTLLGMAGLSKPPRMDGKSILPLLIESNTAQTHTSGGRVDSHALGEGTPLPPSVALHLQATGPAEEYAAHWRTEVFLEYYFVNSNIKCVANCTEPDQEHSYPESDVNCVELRDNAVCWGSCAERHDCPPDLLCSSDCYYTESNANNFIAVRTFGDARELLYALFATGDAAIEEITFSEDNVTFREVYDLSLDRWSMINIADRVSPAERKRLDARLRQWLACAGDDCM